MNPHKHKTLGLLGAVILIAALAGSVFANTLDIRVSIDATKSLTALTTYYDFGAVGVNTSTVSVTPLVIRNNSGGIRETYRLSAGNAISRTLPGTGDWTLSTSTGPDQYALWAQFSTNQPLHPEANWAADQLTITPTDCSATTFGNGTENQSGYNVTPIAPDYDRNLWFRMTTPDVVTDPGEHIATVTITVK